MKANRKFLKGDEEAVSPVIAVILIAPDLHRLAGVLVFNRRVEPSRANTRTIGSSRSS